MGAKTKIHLSKLETELVNNKEWILTKQSIIDKVYGLFGGLHEIYKGIAQQERAFLPEWYINTGGKISRGENYEGLPYVMLDYPAIFSKDSILAVRTMFWWGNFFSITLHLSGNNKTNILEKLINNISTRKENDFYIYQGNDEWEHDLDPNSYKKLSLINDDEFNQIISANNFLKLAIKFPIDSFEAIEEKLLRNYELLVRCCC